MNRGFTLVELVVCVAIFVIMTALLVAKYGTFNQSVLLTDTAYDIALAIHTAQSYGLSVKDAGPTVSCSGNDISSGFNCAYGIDFVASPLSIYCGNTGIISSGTNITLFADVSENGICNNGDVEITSYAITRGAIISGVCASNSQTCSAASDSELDVTYLRPYPDATICWQGICSYTYGQVTLKATDGSLRTISVYQNGQITVNQ